MTTDHARPLGRLITAMITPMNRDYSLDLDGAAVLVEHLVRTGTDSVLVNGSTGEAPVTSDPEKLSILRAVVEAAAGDVPVIAGVGTSSTEHSIALAKDAERAGARALLVVAPAYNIPTQDQLVFHFTEIADATDLPVIIYDIPRRTGVRVQPETVARVAEHPKVIGLKEACGDLGAVMWLARRVPVTIWTGEDALLLPFLAAGCYGIVAFASHLVGEELRCILDAFADRDFDRAFEAQAFVTDVALDLFTLPNPMRLKAVLTELGLPAGPTRPPLQTIDPLDVTDLVKRLREKWSNPESLGE
jgi:4-hydroxy-tetrahydrodipicolinate synthase